MVISSISKLSSYRLLSGLPSIDEMKVALFPVEETNAASRCPRLRVLSYSARMNYYHERFVAFLRARKDNLEAGVEDDKIQMEPLKKLIIPFEGMSPQNPEHLKELVETILDPAREPLWEVEI